MSISQTGQGQNYSEGFQREHGGGEIERVLRDLKLSSSVTWCLVTIMLFNDIMIVEKSDLSWFVSGGEKFSA